MNEEINSQQPPMTPIPPVQSQQFQGLPESQPPKKSKSKFVIIAVLVGIFIITALAGAYIFFSSKDSDQTKATTEIIQVAMTPEKLVAELNIIIPNSTNLQKYPSSADDHITSINLLYTSSVDGYDYQVAPTIPENSWTSFHNTSNANTTESVSQGIEKIQDYLEKNSFTTKATTDLQKNQGQGVNIYVSDEYTCVTQNSSGMLLFGCSSNTATEQVTKEVRPIVDALRSGINLPANMTISGINQPNIIASKTDGYRIITDLSFDEIDTTSPMRPIYDKALMYEKDGAWYYIGTYGVVLCKDIEANADARLAFLGQACFTKEPPGSGGETDSTVN